MAATEGWIAAALAMVVLAATPPVWSLTLPEDRVEALYHVYDGGGVTAQGPAVLLRKGMTASTAISAGYYVDSISSASIDVLTHASPYDEKRTEWQAAVDMLHRDSLIGITVMRSEEPDYRSQTWDLRVAHEVFGGLTTLSLGFGRGQDEIAKRGAPTFAADAQRSQYRLGVSQVLTRRLVTSLNYEAILEEGFLNNPYRPARVLGASVPEIYPGTRHSSALAWRTRYRLGHPASLRLDLRVYRDTWQVNALTTEMGYARQVSPRWLWETRYRFYAQDSASFYSDNFTVPQNFMARDKELSGFSSHTLGTRVSFQRDDDPVTTLKRLQIGFGIDWLLFNYDDFTDLRSGSLYTFHALIGQFYGSWWF